MNSVNNLGRIYELVKELNRASDAYYNTDKEIMTDAEYDKLYDELVRLEKETGYILTSSPSQKVGYEVKSKLAKVKHNIPLLSLDKIQNDINRLDKFIGSLDTIFMLKGDGLTVELIYDNRELIQASTRGNGEIGEEITANAKTFKNIPLKIPFNGYIKVSGEAVIFDKNFEEINSKLSDENKYSNSRNLVAGSVRQLNSEICSQRNVNFLTFNLLEIKDQDGNEINFETVTDQFEFLGNLGFYMIPHVFIKANSDNSKEVIDVLKTYAEDNGIPIDGIVIRYNDVKYGDSLGTTAHHPLHSMAFKFRNEEYETKYIQTEWQVSRTGLINPVGIFEPVEIDGAEINRATLHNVDYFNSLKLGKGDTISIIRSNEVIPKVISNSVMSGTETIPDVCPVCGAKTEVRLMKTANVLYCSNTDCAARKLSQFTHFVKKSCMNIDGLSEATLERFINKGFVKTYVDIFNLDQYREEIIKMSGLGLKSYNNLINSIEKAKKVKLPNFIFALGIAGVGLETSKLICKHFNNSLNSIQMACTEDFEKIDGIGQVTAKSLSEWLKNENNEKILNELLEFVEFEAENTKEVINRDSIFSGKKIYCTGTFKNYKKNELKELLESLDATFANGYAKSLDYLIVGSLKGSSKVDKALKDSIKVLEEDEFVKMI